MWKTGHSLIKSKMKQEGALLAGEMSGHIFFNDRYYGFDDAIYASLRFLEIVSRHKGSVSSLLEDVPVYFTTPEIRIDTTDREKFSIVEKVGEYFKEKYHMVLIDLAGHGRSGWGSPMAERHYRSAREVESRKPRQKRSNKASSQKRAHQENDSESIKDGLHKAEAYGAYRKRSTSGLLAKDRV